MFCNSYPGVVQANPCSQIRPPAGIVNRSILTPVKKPEIIEAWLGRDDLQVRMSCSVIIDPGSRLSH